MERTTLRDREAVLSSVDLYPVISGPRFNLGRRDEEILEAALAGGVRMVQLRGKTLTGWELFEQARRFREATRRHGALLIINDRLDVAMASGADGVHLGQTDLPVHVARQLVPDLLIGASTHSAEQAIQAQREGASYVNIGPIYTTGTKEGITKYLGPAAIPEIAGHLQIPFTVMGGIKAHHIEELMLAGARILAVVTAVSEAEDVEAAVREFRQAMAACPGRRSVLP